MILRAVFKHCLSTDLHYSPLHPTQAAFICSNSTMETLEQRVQSVPN